MRPVGIAIIKVNNTERSFHHGETNWIFDPYQERMWPATKKQTAISRSLVTYHLINFVFWKTIEEAVLVVVSEIGY